MATNLEIRFNTLISGWYPLAESFLSVAPRRRDTMDGYFEILLVIWYF